MHVYMYICISFSMNSGSRNVVLEISESESRNGKGPWDLIFPKSLFGCSEVLISEIRHAQIGLRPGSDRAAIPNGLSLLRTSSLRV